MKPLSPVDAIAPAFSRMRTLLLPPDPLTGQPGRFRFWFFVKMTLVGAFTSAGMYEGGISMVVEMMVLAAMAAGAQSRLGHSVSSPFAGPGVAFAMVALLFGGFVVLAVVVILGWLWSRLRFTLFDLIVYRHGRVGAAWSRYGSQAWRYLGITILVGLVLLILLVATAGPVVLHLVLTLRHLTPQQMNADPGAVMGAVLPLYGVILPFALLVGLVDGVLQDFLLPPMAMENAPIERSLGRFFRLVRGHFGQVVLYFILRLVLLIGLTMAGGLAAFLVMAVVGGFAAGGGFILYHAIAHAGAVGMAAFVLYCIVAGLVVFALYFLAVIVLNGLVGIFKECFAAYFYGSHYPELGDRLEPPPPAAVPAMPAPPQPPPAGSVPEPPSSW